MCSVDPFCRHLFHHSDSGLLEHLPTVGVEGFLSNYLRYAGWPVRISFEVVVGTVICSIIVSASTLERE
jgi:hypothetical protein